MTKGELHLYEDKGVMRVCSASKIPLVRYIFLFLTSEKKIFVNMAKCSSSHLL